MPSAPVALESSNSSGVSLIQVCILSPFRMYAHSCTNAMCSAGLKPLLPLFTQLLADSRETYTALRISVYYTRALASADAMKPFERLPLGLTITPGRPRLNKLLEGVADRTAGSGGVNGLTGVVVGVCGPPALGSSVGKAVEGLDRKRRDAVGSVELHEECVLHSIFSLHC